MNMAPGADILTLLKQGFYLPEIAIGDTRNKLVDFLNINLREQRFKQGGYIFYGVFRVGYDSENKIDEISIYFTGDDSISLPIHIALTGEDYLVSNKLLLHEFI